LFRTAFGLFNIQIQQIKIRHWHNVVDTTNPQQIEVMEFALIVAEIVDYSR